jgi:hypothetical protein
MGFNFVWSVNPYEIDAIGFWFFIAADGTTIVDTNVNSASLKIGIYFNIYSGKIQIYKEGVSQGSESVVYVANVNMLSQIVLNGTNVNVYQDGVSVVTFPFSISAMTSTDIIGFGARDTTTDGFEAGFVIHEFRPFVEPIAPVSDIYLAISSSTADGANVLSLCDYQPSLIDDIRGDANFAGVPLLATSTMSMDGLFPSGWPVYNYDVITGTTEAIASVTTFSDLFTATTTPIRYDTTGSDVFGGTRNLWTGSGGSVVTVDGEWNNDGSFNGFSGACNDWTSNAVIEAAAGLQIGGIRKLYINFVTPRVCTQSFHVICAFTVAPSASTSPSTSASPTSPSLTPTISVTATISPTPVSLTPTISVTPSISVSGLPSVSSSESPDLQLALTRIIYEGVLNPLVPDDGNSVAMTVGPPVELYAGDTGAVKAFAHIRWENTMGDPSALQYDIVWQYNPDNTGTIGMWFFLADVTVDVAGISAHLPDYKLSVNFNVLSKVVTIYDHGTGTNLDYTGYTPNEDITTRIIIREGTVEVYMDGVLVGGVGVTNDYDVTDAIGFGARDTANDGFETTFTLKEFGVVAPPSVTPSPSPSTSMSISSVPSISSTISPTISITPTTSISPAPPFIGQPGDYFIYKSHSRNGDIGGVVSGPTNVCATDLSLMTSVGVTIVGDPIVWVANSTSSLSDILVDHGVTNFIQLDENPWKSVATWMTDTNYFDGFNDILRVDGISEPGSNTFSGAIDQTTSSTGTCSDWTSVSVSYQSTFTNGANSFTSSYCNNNSFRFMCLAQAVSLPASVSPSVSVSTSAVPSVSISISPSSSPPSQQVCSRL